VDCHGFIIIIFFFFFFFCGSAAYGLHPQEEWVFVVVVVGGVNRDCWSWRQQGRQRRKPNFRHWCGQSLQD
jgi:hypothetical protein